MAQNNSGVRSLLGNPTLFKLFINILGGAEGTRVLVDNYICPRPRERVLDIGCGMGRMVDFLPDVEYHGFDSDPDYIAAAIKAYGSKATFLCEKVTDSNLKETEYFDVVLAIGVLHHLDDRESEHLFKLAKKALKVGGRLITIDCTFVEGQSKIARWIISRDRGQNVRTAEGYYKLAALSFERIKCDVRHDMLRIPYTHTILQCFKD